MIFNRVEERGVLEQRRGCGGRGLDVAGKVIVGDEFELKAGNICREEGEGDEEWLKKLVVVAGSVQSYSV